jgi:hypothetical protein
VREVAIGRAVGSFAVIEHLLLHAAGAVVHLDDDHVELLRGYLKTKRQSEK